MMMLLNEIITVVSSLFFLAAIYFSLKLARESPGEPYWIFFTVAAIAFASYHLLQANLAVDLLTSDQIFLVKEFLEIVGAFALAYACFGLYTEMKRIRKRVKGLKA